MIRNSAKLAVLGALALVGGAVGLNCSKDSNPSGSGALKIAFAIPGGTTISSVHYAMTLNGASGPSGDFNTSDVNSSPSFDIALQPSTNDTITLTATTSGGVSCTTGVSPAFSIISNQPTTVSLTLVCGSGSATSLPGTVDVRANVTSGDNCPNITQVVVAPYQTSVGGTISLTAVASDSDAVDMLSYSWSSTGGTFATPTGTSDVFTCVTAGAQSITLAVNDNHAGGGCTASISLPVNCVAVGGTGGDGRRRHDRHGRHGHGRRSWHDRHGRHGHGRRCWHDRHGRHGHGRRSWHDRHGRHGHGRRCWHDRHGRHHRPNSVQCTTCEKAGNSVRCTQDTNYYVTNGGFGCDSFTNQTDVTNCLALVACLRSTACQTVIAQAPSDFSEANQKFGDPFPCLCNNPTGTQITSAACSAATTWTGVCAAAYNAAESTQAAPSLLADLYNNITPTGVGSNLLSCDIESTNNCKSASTCIIPQ